METPATNSTFWIDLNFIPCRFIHDLSFFFAGFTLTLLAYSLKSPRSKLPLVNPRKAFEVSDSRIKKDFILNAPDIFERGFTLTGNKPFRVNADIGEVIILPPELANEVRNDTRLSFSEFMYRVKVPDSAKFYKSY